MSIETNQLSGSTLEPTPTQVESEFQAGVEINKATNLERQAFVRQVMHPPSAEPLFNGWPSMDARSQVIMRNSFMNLYKQRVIVGANNIATPVADSVDFNLGFLMLPSLRNLCVGWTQNSAGIFTQDIANTFSNDVANWNNFTDDVNLFRVIARSTTFEPNMTAFNNQGAVVACQFNPSLLFSGTLTQFVEQMPSQAAHFISCNLIDCRVAPQQIDVWELCTEHMHHIIRMRCAKANIKLPSLIELRTLDLDDKLALDPNLPIQVLNLGEAQLTGFPSQSQILNMSTRSYSNLAREGCFVVQRPNKLEPKWNVAGRAGGSGDVIPRLYQCWLYTTYNGSTFIPLRESTTIGQAAPIMFDALWTPDMTAAWVRFDGLSINTTLSASSARQLLAVKSFVIAEYQPAAISPYAGLQRLSPVPDLHTIEQLMRDFYTLKDALPSCCNSWGAIASIVGPHLVKFGSELAKNIFSSKPARQTRNAPTKRTIKKDENKLAKDVAKLAIDTTRRAATRRPPRQNHQRGRSQPRKQQQPVRTMTFVNSNRRARSLPPAKPGSKTKED